MLYRFTGQYTGGRKSITVFGVTFEGHEPAEVTDEEAIRRLSTNREFEAVPDKLEDRLDVSEPLYVLDPPKKRGRPKKG